MIPLHPSQSYNTQQGYVYHEQVHEQSTPLLLTHLMESLSWHGRKLLKEQHSPLTQRQNWKSMKDVVVTDDYLVYSEEQPRIKAMRRDYITSTGDAMVLKQQTLVIHQMCLHSVF